MGPATRHLWFASSSGLLLDDLADSDRSVLAIRRYGYRHTAPFLLSLALEYLARSLRQTSQRSPFGMGSPGHLSEVEKNEVARRQRAFWWYLLRGPVWEGWTKPQIEGMTNALQGKPIIGLFAAILKDYTPLIGKSLSLDGQYAN